MGLSALFPGLSRQEPRAHQPSTAKQELYKQEDTEANIDAEIAATERQAKATKAKAKLLKAKNKLTRERAERSSIEERTRSLQRDSVRNFTTATAKNLLLASALFSPVLINANPEINSQEQRQEEDTDVDVERPTRARMENQIRLPSIKKEESADSTTPSKKTFKVNKRPSVKD